MKTTSKQKTKKIAALFAAAVLALAANADIETRSVVFGADEIPATNPRIERRGDIVTHIEVFAPFVVAEDGSATTTVAETSVDMDAVTAGVWIKEARKAVGGRVRSFSKIRLKIAIAKIGKLSELEAWLASLEVAPGYSALEAWNDAQVIQDDFEGFTRFYEAAKIALGVTDEQAAAILDACQTED